MGELFPIRRDVAEMKHADLVDKAAAWLRAKATVVITELSFYSTTGESADVIGFTNRESILIEVKVSRADFLKDRHKCFRREPSRGMGARRYFCAPAGLIAVDELPERWGLIVWDVTRGVMRKAREAKYQAHSSDNEVRLLVSALRRLSVNECRSLMARCYVFESKRRASIGISLHRQDTLGLE